MNRERLWTRDFVLAALAGFFAAMVIYTLITVMAVYSAGKYGAGEGLAGFTASIGMVGGIIGRLFAGAHTERLGRRRVAMAASALNAAVCALYFLPVGVGALLAIRLAHGAMAGCVHNVMSAVSIDFIPPSRRAEGIAFYTLHFTFAAAAGPPFALYIVKTWSYTALFYANLGFALASLAILLFIRFVPTSFTEGLPAQARGEAKPDRPTSEAPPVYTIGESKHNGAFEKMALPLAYIAALLGMCWTAVFAFVETYTRLIGAAWVASAFFVVGALSIIATRPFAGLLVDRRGENFVIVPAIILYAASFIVLGLAGYASQAFAPSLIIAASVLIALGFGTFLPMGQAALVKYGEPRRLSRIISTYFIFSDAGMGVGALVMGFVAAGIGFSNMFFTGTAVALAALAIYWRLHGRRHRGLASAAGPQQTPPSDR